MSYKRLISFDFDDTLFHTPKPEQGEQIWKEKTGTDWPYSGWWGRPESCLLYTSPSPRDES
jgi:FMN phosphatase YigB (HAD superfamily)